VLPEAEGILHLGDLCSQEQRNTCSHEWEEQLGMFFFFLIGGNIFHKEDAHCAVGVLPVG